MAGRRPKGDGSITELPNCKFKVRIEVNPVGDKRKLVTRTVDTITEARKTLKELERQKETGRLIISRPETFKEFSKRFLDDLSREGELKESTLQDYFYTLRFWETLFGDLPIQKITPKRVQEETIHLKKKYKHNTVASFLRVLRRCFRMAVDEKIIMENPVKNGKATVSVNVKKALQIITEEEHKELVEHMKTHYNKFKENHIVTPKTLFMPMYLLTFETGMRIGETVGLWKKSLVFSENLLNVENNIIKVVGEGLKDSPPKTESSIRPIYLTDNMVALLKEVLEIYKEIGIDSRYVFCNKEGSPFYATYLNDAFNDFKELAGIDREFTFHDIRHTNASILLSSGIDMKTVSERLGHSSVTITVNTYAHSLKVNKQRAASVFQAQAGSLFR